LIIPGLHNRFSTRGETYKIYFAYGRIGEIIKRIEGQGHFDTGGRMRNDTEQDVAQGRY
jgi:hypothetical protein